MANSFYFRRFLSDEFEHLRSYRIWMFKGVHKIWWANMLYLMFHSHTLTPAKHLSGGIQQVSFHPTLCLSKQQSAIDMWVKCEHGMRPFHSNFEARTVQLPTPSLYANFTYDAASWTDNWIKSFDLPSKWRRGGTLSSLPNSPPWMCNIARAK